MATYKVIQDVEAEDKILGPLTLKQLIFAIIMAGFGFGAFRVVSLTGSIFTAIPFLPFMIIFGALAAPLGKNQPTEVWLAAQIHFLTKPRVRLWDQSDLKEVVHITVPKKERKIYTDGLNQKQVKSRLSALASTLDSHGWAVKNVVSPSNDGSAMDDRLIYVQPEMAVPEEPATADIFAPNGTEAREFDAMMQSADAQHKQQIKQMMQQAAQQAKDIQPTQTSSISPLKQPDSPIIANAQPLAPALPAEPSIQPATQFPNYQTQTPATNNPSPQQPQITLQEQALYNKILEQKHIQDKVPAPNNNHKVVLPLGQTNKTDKAVSSTMQPPVSPAVAPGAQKQTNKVNNAIIAQEAYAKESPKTATAFTAEHRPKQKQSSDEVIIKLH